MNPKKTKELVSKVAQEMGFTESLIESVIREYWKEVWYNITTLNGYKIHIENLGDLNIKSWALDKEIERCRMLLEKKYSNKVNYPTILKTRNKLELMQKLKISLEEEKQRKEFLYEHRKNKTDLEKQEGYIPGDIL